MEQNGSLLLNGNGPARRTYALESSNDLRGWVEIDGKDNPTGTVSFLVTPPALSAYQFYRARLVS